MSDAEFLPQDKRADASAPSWKDKAFEALVWLMMPLVFGSAWAVIDLIWIVAKRAWTGSWSFLTLGDACAKLSIHFQNKVAAWPLSAVVLLITLAAFGAMTDSQVPTAAPIAKERTPMHLPRFFWPRSPKSETTVLIRMGRVLHWCSIVAAAGALILAVVIGWDSVTYAARSAEDARQWDLAHPDGKPPSTAFYDSRPYVAESYLGTALMVGVAAAFGIAVSGRGIRYVLAGE